MRSINMCAQMAAFGPARDDDDDDDDDDEDRGRVECCSRTGGDDGLEAALSGEVVVGEVRLEHDHHLVGLARERGARSLVAAEPAAITGQLPFTPVNRFISLMNNVYINNSSKQNHYSYLVVVSVLEAFIRRRSWYQVLLLMKASDRDGNVNKVRIMVVFRRIFNTNFCSSHSLRFAVVS